MVALALYDREMPQPSGALSLPCDISLLRLELFVRDVDRSLRFYEQALGFVSAVPASAHTDGYSPIRNGSVHIGLCSIDSLPSSHYFRSVAGAALGIGVEIVLEVDCLLEYERRARTMGAVLEPIQLREWGLRDFRVVDPDGYYIPVTEKAVAS